MKYRITRLCGKSDYTVKFDGKIDSILANKFLESLKDFEVKVKSSDSIWLQKREKNIFMYFYGEILFVNFSGEEVESIVKLAIGE
jgi:uncharacterized Rmd1/YagE family protein